MLLPMKFITDFGVMAVLPKLTFVCIYITNGQMPSTEDNKTTFYLQTFYPGEVGNTI